MNIIFMGTPEFAVPALASLIKATEHHVMAVYTQPPRPAGRGQADRPSPIQQLAESHHIPVYTPLSLRDKATQEAFTQLNADVAVVAAYGLILPEPILKGCRFGCLNIHPSLLPRWRGAAPIQRSIMAGDTKTGVAIMQMDKGLDTGDILALETTPLPGNMTAGELHDQLAIQGAALLLKTLASLESIIPTPQAKEGVAYAEKIRKEEGHIDWNQTTKHIACLIRGLTPWPGAFFIHQNERIKVFGVDPAPNNQKSSPGTVLNDQLTVACADGALRITRVQRPGKGVMDTAAMLRGFPIAKGIRLL